MTIFRRHLRGSRGPLVCYGKSVGRYCLNLFFSIPYPISRSVSSSENSKTKKNTRHKKHFSTSSLVTRRHFIDRMQELQLTTQEKWLIDTYLCRSVGWSASLYQNANDQTLIRDYQSVRHQASVIHTDRQSNSAAIDTANVHVASTPTDFFFLNSHPVTFGRYFFV